MKNKDYLKKFINLLECPVCNGSLNNKSDTFLSCNICNKKYKIHNNKIIKLFTSDNIYPTKDKINWKNIYE